LRRERPKSHQSSSAEDCHVWSLIELGRPLVRRKFEAWEFGPVLSYLYREFRDHDRSPITERATQLDPADGKQRVVAHDFDSHTDSLLHRIASFYSQLRAGDRRWKALLSAHDDIVRQELERFRGNEVKSLGDGFLATFDGPARAVHCALSIIEAVGTLGIEVRAGVHTGEVEIQEADVHGVAVHIAARIAERAAAGQCLVSRTVKDLVAGAELKFTERGKHHLKGLAEAIELASASR
jgi:Adenylate and Guanylate cyclase catalytic domain/Protein of unknown function (DUF4065)